MPSIFVGNLSHSATEDQLREAFSEFGKVSSVSIMKDRDTGRPRGFAFVEMTDGKEAAAAIQQLNLQELAGRSMTVNEARPKADRPRGGGGGGGGGGRRKW